MRVIRWTGVILVVCVSMLVAQDTARRGLPEVMSVADVRPGMEGYGLSVFEGAEIEKFQFKVLGKVRNWSAQGTVILVRMSGRVIDESGTISGMSGSPVFIDDKLVGAVAYGFVFSEAPIAGITPIEEMLVVRDIDVSASAQSTADARGARRAQAREQLRDEVARMREDVRAGRLAGRDERAAALRAMLGRQRRPMRGLAGAGEAPSAFGAGGGFQRLPVPISVGGLNGDALGRIAHMLPGGVVTPAQAGSVAGDNPASPALEPGAPIGALFVTGDIQIAGMGTLTAIDGDRVLAFGHPMDGAGTVDYPLALGNVEAVVPSAYHSFRLTSPTRVVGRMIQDRDTAILGRLGEESPMFPVTVTVNGTEKKTFRYQVASYWESAPWLVHTVASASLVRWEGELSRLTVQERPASALRDAEPIVVRNRFASDWHDWMVFDLVTWPVGMLVMNPMSEVRVTGIEVALDVTPEWRTAVIEDVRAARKTVRPGGVIDLDVKLRPWRGEPEWRRMSLAVPRDAAPGTVGIDVGDSYVASWNQRSADSGFFDPQDVEGLIRVIESLPTAEGVYAYASFARRGLRYEGEAMPNLPSSALHILTHSDAATSLAPLIRAVQAKIETPWVVEGSGGVQVTVIDPARGTGVEYP